MIRRSKRLVMLASVLTLSGVVAASFASAQSDRGAVKATQAASRTLNIYGMGGRDDVAQGRLDYAATVMGSDVDIQNPVGGFNDQAFLAQLAAGNVPDLVYVGRGSVGTYAAKNAFLPLTSCIKNQKVPIADYRKAALQEVTYKKAIYALPEFTNQITILANAGVARDAGVNIADIQTTNWKRLKAANKKMLKIENGKLTRIGFDPKIPEFFPLWVKWFGKDLVSKDGLKAQLNSKEAVAALAFTVGLINDHGGWNKFKAFRDTFDFFGSNNPMKLNQIGAWPMESFIYNVFADNSPNVELQAKYFTNRKGGPITMFSGNGWAIPRGAKDQDLACKFMKAMTSVTAWKTVAKARFDLRKRQNRAYTGLYTANTKADVKTYEDIYQPIGKKAFDDAVTLLVRAPRYGFAIPLSPASVEIRQAWTDGINRVLNGQQSPKQALDQAQKEAQAAINKAK
jgi:multiple sugar transport system substrate-binding protein